MPNLNLDMTVPADSCLLKCIRGAVAPFFGMVFDDDEVQRLVLAVDEACANIIKHGQSWLRPKGSIRLSLTGTKKRIEVSVFNFCREKDVPKIKPRDLDDVKPGGLGTHFINEVMDSVEFVPDPDHQGRVILVMTKNTSGKRDHEADC